MRCRSSLVLHGAGGDPEEIEAGSGWNALADERLMVIAYPEGDGGDWNAGACCGVAVREAHDDVGFLEALIDHLDGFAQIDPTRVVVVGHSNGGMMAYRLACDPDANVLGVASVSGTNMAGCQPAHPLVVHGDPWHRRSGRALQGRLDARERLLPGCPRSRRSRCRSTGWSTRSAVRPRPQEATVAKTTTRDLVAVAATARGCSSSR